MSYTKQNFTTGQILKASHLNYMESGISDNADAIATNTSNIETLNNNLSYIDLSSKITVSDGFSMIPYCENGLIVLYGTIPAGTTGNVLMATINDTKYRPRTNIHGSIGIVNSTNDMEKINSITAYADGRVKTWVNSTLDYTEAFTIIYPMRNI